MSQTHNMNNIFFPDKNMTSSNSSTSKKIISHEGNFRSEVFDSTLPTINTATTVDKQTLQEAVRVAKNKYGKAFDKLAKE